MQNPGAIDNTEALSKFRKGFDLFDVRLQECNIGDTVTLGQSGNVAVIQVRDNGPGIPLDIRNQVFEPFFTTKARGGGLGLPIARRTAELHGGSLTLECPEGGGTVVTMKLPLRPVASENAGASKDAPLRVQAGL